MYWYRLQIKMDYKKKMLYVYFLPQERIYLAVTEQQPFQLGGTVCREEKFIKGVMHFKGLRWFKYVSFSLQNIIPKLYNDISQR